MNMLSSFFAFINKDFSYERVEQMEPNKATNFVLRDNLRKKLSANKQKKPQFLAQEKDGKNLKITNHANRTVEEKSEAIRIKVRMTKEEAVRLLSKCKEGKVLGFKDVAQELAQIPVHRVSVVSYNTSRCGAVLKSIQRNLRFCLLLSFSLALFVVGLFLRRAASGSTYCNIEVVDVKYLYEREF